MEIAMPLLRLSAALAGLVVALAGCSSSGDSTRGPEPVADGSYAFLASSVGDTQSATLQVSGMVLTLAQDGATSTTGTIGAGAPEAVLCPPSGTGQPLRIDRALTMGELRLATPAIFGDCGQTTPERVTLIDLDSYDEAAGPFKYTRWVEFCDTTDPDCSSSKG